MFRCVLDGRPRSVVAALAPNVWVAYDPATGGLAKVFDGGVEFVGSVYDGAHGPQPKSKGNELLAGPRQEAWSWLRAAGGAAGGESSADPSVRFRPRFLGYRVDGNRLRISRRLDASLATDRVSVRIEESPEVATGTNAEAKDGIRLTRTFRIEGLPEGHELVVDLGKGSAPALGRLAAGADRVASFKILEGRMLRVFGTGKEIEVTVVHDWAEESR